MIPRGGVYGDRLVLRTPRVTPMLATVLLLLFLAVPISRSLAQSNADPGQAASDTGGPIVIPSARRVQQPVARSPNGGPVVIPQIATPAANAPATGNAAPAAGAPATNRARAEERPRPPRPVPTDRTPSQPANAAAPVAPNPLFQPNPDGGPRITAGFRQTAGLDALYGATHFRGAAPRPDPDGFFGAPTAGLLGGSCGLNRNGPDATNAKDRCMQALAFAVSPPPATRQVLPRNLPRISPRDAQPMPPVAADKPMTPPAMPMDPFEPTGFTVGNFVVKPAVELTTGYDSNPGRVPGGKGSPVVVIAPVVSVRSQFDKHQLNADVRAAYVDDTQANLISHPTVDARINGRYDLADTTALNGEGHFILDADDPGTARFTGRFTKIPLVSTVGASGGVTQKFDPFEVSVKGAVDHIQFQNVGLTDGQILSNQDRNFNQYAVQSRVSYALNDQYHPFVDVAVDRRVHEQQVDMLGFRRDSTGTAVEGGVTFALTDKLTGDAAIGYLVRQYQDAMLKPVSGFIADANLMYQINPENTLQLGAKSQVAEIAEPGISGVLKRDVSLEYDHQFEPWLIGTVMTGYGADVFVGSAQGRVDNRYFVDFGMLYKVSRLLQLQAHLRQEMTKSNVKENNLDATVVTVGARVQY
jgi:hypothetical protein